MQASDIIIIGSVVVAITAGIWLTAHVSDRSDVVKQNMTSEPEEGSLLDIKQNAEDAAAMIEASGSGDINAVLSE